MIKAILDRLKRVDGAIVREGFYVYSIAKESQFIFLQPYTDAFGGRNGNDKYKDDLVLQVVAGINLTKSDTPTLDLTHLVHRIRTVFYVGQRDTSKPEWLTSVRPIISFIEPEPCKYIMPEANEKHGLAVITLSISNTVKFGELL
ncbi:hypothetical protein CXF83_14960 [Shewanella sp. Choline-02u-19]|uniref:hypothetical protein n=1 Tax=unclassified Shewanella TaxID=196818 RepID=UPI000C33C619|nr:MULTISPECIES: hypothetical protein [unclassified Shewanella]PKH62571.1 hypothetical protein CXF84_00970 [Shewanella sp. Bg11-22]PKI27918.1 hypothetical protein CXF83_14960 [Shewanella sp. Choline-02u-19]